MATAMVHLAKSDSERVHEQVARVFLALVEDPAHRGQVISEGGAKALVLLATTNTDKGKHRAAQVGPKIAGVVTTT